MSLVYIEHDLRETMACMAGWPDAIVMFRPDSCLIPPEKDD